MWMIFCHVSKSESRVPRRRRFTFTQKYLNAHKKGTIETEGDVCLLSIINVFTDHKKKVSCSLWSIHLALPDTTHTPLLCRSFHHGYSTYHTALDFRFTIITLHYKTTPPFVLSSYTNNIFYFIFFKSLSYFFNLLLIKMV